jgi:hypothetical protein
MERQGRKTPHYLVVITPGDFLSQCASKTSTASKMATRRLETRSVGRQLPNREAKSLRPRVEYGPKAIQGPQQTRSSTQLEALRYMPERIAEADILPNFGKPPQYDTLAVALQAQSS